MKTAGCAILYMAGAGCQLAAIERWLWLMNKSNRENRGGGRERRGFCLAST